MIALWTLTGLLFAQVPSEPGEEVEHKDIKGSPEPAPPGAAGGDPSVGGPAPIEGRGPNFMLALQDISDLAGGRAVIATIQAADSEEILTYEMMDDGEPPDPIASDGHYHRAVADYPDGPVTVSLLAGDEVLTATEVEIPLDMLMPSLRVTLTSSDADWLLASDAEMAAEVAAYEQDPELAVTPSGSGGGAGMLGVGLVPGLLLGAGGGWARWGRRRRAAAVTPTHSSAPPGLPVGGSMVWQVPEASRSQAIGALARRLSDAGPVLVVPLASSRPALARRLAGVPGVCWLDEEHPTVDRLQRAVDHLSAIGTVSVLVEGSRALELPGPKEPPAAVVAELLEVMDAVLLVAAGEPTPGAPQRSLEAIPGGLGDAAGLVVALSDAVERSEE